MTLETSRYKKMEMTNQSVQG